MLTQTTAGLGPARVTAVVDGRIGIEFATGERAWSRSALGYPYDAAPGDEVLVIGQEVYYVIGVLSATGPSRLSTPGDLILHAGGTVEIIGEQGIQLTSPSVAVQAGRFEVLAQTILEQATNSYRWIKQLIKTYAGSVQTISESSYTVDAQMIVQHADKDVAISGERINLG